MCQELYSALPSELNKGSMEQETIKNNINTNRAKWGEVSSRQAGGKSFSKEKTNKWKS